MKINNTTKKAKQFVKAYLNAKSSTLDELYRTYSNNKKQAYDYCVQEYFVYEGINFKILSANNFFFTVGFISEIFGTRDLIIITKSTHYRIPEYEKALKN